LLILTLAVPFAVPFFFLHYQKKQVRKEVKEMIVAGLEKEELVLLSFTYEETETVLNWHHSREFEYQGEMYDIVEAEYREDGVTFRCWHDKKESVIHRKMDNLVAQILASDPQKKENQQRLNNYLKVQYLSSNYSWNPFADLILLCSEDEFISRYQSRYISPPNPPPRSFS
jgi:hypothetical protein